MMTLLADNSTTTSDSTTPLLSAAEVGVTTILQATTTTPPPLDDIVESTSSLTAMNNNSITTTTTTTGLQHRNRTMDNNNRGVVPSNNNNDNDRNEHENDDSTGIPNRWNYYAQQFVHLLLLPITDVEGSFTSIVKGFLVMVVIGTIIGFVTPTNSTFPIWYGYVSNCIGYIYFVAWSVSFYPQVLQNIQRKTTVGLSIDFCCLNIIGFICYTTYTCSLYYNHTIQDLYHERYGPHATITIQINDIAFAVHALTLSILTVIQILYYDGFRNAVQRLSKPIVIIITVLVLTASMAAILVVVLNQSHKKDDNNLQYYSLVVGTSSALNWLDYIYLLSYIKIIISIIKYIPQVILNYQRKSTVGWSVWQILLDCMGGILSDIQLAADCYIMNHNFSSITQNLPKFGLGFISIVFDVIFMFQHYILYKNNNWNSNSSTTTAIGNTTTTLGTDDTDNNNNNNHTSTSEEVESLLTNSNSNNNNNSSSAVTQFI